ncbi:leucine-rich repeat and guanylate kinase domain-containing protein isoform X2 [Octodon degus]|uniref:Leucine-rich repeat and guanylate kinase domain-containing protein isoform X2 n=1 Tax=Octodon degus TaxID=10160 RepID=A0A6P6E075_OCTDE|nr:leucine-rich repeat and guanylate kinase domain-containing protein isoform X2 [Octodon degus]
MGQRTKSTFHRTSSSHLLQQLIRRSQDEEQGEGESEESSESDTMNLEDEFDGVLTEETVAKALHELGRSGSGTEQVYLNLTLSGCDLTNISILCGYVHLQKLDLSVNKIEDLSCVSCMPYLLELDASQNKLTTFFNFKPPKNLKSNNLIEKVTGLEDLKILQNLDLSHNQINSLQGLEDHSLLEVINLEDNKIAELDEIEYIENLPILRILNLLRNPVQEKSEYWLFVIFMLLRLTELDKKKIKVEEKVTAVNKYDPPPEVVAAQDHLTHVLNSVMQPQRIFDSTLPSLDAPYPMLILAGPQACGKRELAHRLCRQFNTYFRYGACHTTRPPYFGEGDRVDYHFISQEVFDEMLNMGKFILTFNYGSYSYGLNRDTVEGIARDGLASCIHMEIEGVRSLKCSYFEPRYILVIPMNKEKYEGYLRRKGLFSRAEIEFAVSRVDLYIKINQKFPGYFDAVINADDLDVAYQKLSQLIREYLGLVEEPAKGLAPTVDVKISHLKHEEHLRKSFASSMNDFLDSTDRNYFVKLWAKLAAKKTPVERDSLCRQHETARQALRGKIPSDHTLLFQRGPVPAPVVSELKQGFVPCQDYFGLPFPQYAEESGKDSQASMKHSVLFPPSLWSKELPSQLPEDGIYTHPGSPVSDSEADKALKALCIKSSSQGKASVQHRKPSVMVISRPGSNTKPSLPPIPHGHNRPVLDI